MTTTAISNLDDVIDSRDVIARIEELEAEHEELADNIENAMPGTRTEHVEALKEWDAENGDELRALKALADEAEGYAADWKYGEALIRDSYFETYAEQFADDIGAINSEASWPNNCIDWERAARELQMDYTSVDFDGITYWIR